MNPDLQPQKTVVLLVEDETDAGSILKDFLEKKEYVVHWAETGQQALAMLDEKRSKINIAILDIMIPGRMREILKNIRGNILSAKIPVIFLTAKDRETDEISGLDLGADDYVRKPISLSLINARIQTLLRRTNPTAGSELRLHDLVVNRGNRTVHDLDKNLGLTNTEFTLFYLLITNPERIFSRADILDRLDSDDDKGIFERTIDVHIKNLRSKLGRFAEMVHTYRNIGYGSMQLNDGATTDAEHVHSDSKLEPALI